MNAAHNVSAASPKFVAQEVTFRKENGEWSATKIITTEKAWDKLVARLEERGAEFLCRDAF